MKKEESFGEKSLVIDRLAPELAPGLPSTWRPRENFTEIITIIITIIITFIIMIIVITIIITRLLA